jgi:hypothetical protein
MAERRTFDALLIISGVQSKPLSALKDTLVTPGNAISRAWASVLKKPIM